MNDLHNGRSIADILRDLLAQLASLLRNERELARAEIGEKIDQAVRGLAFMVAGAVLLVPAMVVLLAAAVAAIMHAGLEPYWAALIVGAAALLLGFVLLLAGRSSVKWSNLVPRRTIDHLRQDVSVAQRQVRHT